MMAGTDGLGPFELDSIVCGDCLDVMRQMPDACVDLVVTDPPYPKLKGGYIRDERFGRAGKINNISMTIGRPWDTSLSWMGEAWRVSEYGLICFCSFHNVADIRDALPQANVMGLMTWHISNPGPTGKNVPQHDTQFVWLFNKAPGPKWDALRTMLIQVPKLPAGCFASERLLLPGTGKAAHPTQKPVSVMLELLRVGGNLIFDPFIGSGTTAVAAKKLGRHYFGCDINPDYVKMARKRLASVQVRLL